MSRLGFRLGENGLFIYFNFQVFRRIELHLFTEKLPNTYWQLWGKVKVNLFITEISKSKIITAKISYSFEDFGNSSLNVVGLMVSGRSLLQFWIQYIFKILSQKGNEICLLGAYSNEIKIILEWPSRCIYFLLLSLFFLINSFILVVVNQIIWCSL